MARYQAVRGTFDVLPGQVSQWHSVEETSRDLAQRFGYKEIRTPLFEQAELFTRGMGVMSGLIEKELWTFQDKFGQKLALRTDATTGIIRAYQQNKLYNTKLPLKVFYLAPVFLLGKEGDTRSRQSHQFGFEAIGSENPALDAEVIALAAAFCEGMGLEDFTIRLNSLGSKDCREEYLQKLKDYFGAHNSQLCATCKRKYKANPDWVLSCEEKECKSLSQVAPTIYGMLTNDARTHFAQLREYLQEMELPVELDPRVVRDSEYYNGTVFEIRCQGKSLGFGGRYDNLVEKLGGKATPAVGFAFSLEAILELLKPEEISDNQKIDLLLRPEGPESAKLLVPLLYTLRQRGISAELDYSFGNGRRNRDNTGDYSWIVTLDESNAFRGNAVVKDLDDNSEERVPVSRLRNRVLHVAGVGKDEERDGSKSGRKKLRRGRRRSEEPKSNKEDEKSNREEKDEKDDSRSKRTRSKGRRSRNSDDRDRDRDKDRDKDKDRERDSSRKSRDTKSEKSDSEKDTSSRSSKYSKSKSRRNSRSKNSSDNSKTDKPAAKADGDLGKAIVPVFGLGGGPAPEAPKAKPEKSKPSKRRAKAATPAAAPAGGLNWSILPGKEES